MDYNLICQTTPEKRRHPGPKDGFAFGAESNATAHSEYKFEEIPQNAQDEAAIGGAASQRA
jgi:hypothetical protein